MSANAADTALVAPKAADENAPKATDDSAKADPEVQVQPCVAKSTDANEPDTSRHFIVGDRDKPTFYINPVVAGFSVAIITTFAVWTMIHTTCDMQTLGSCSDVNIETMDECNAVYTWVPEGTASCTHCSGDDCDAVPAFCTSSDGSDTCVVNGGACDGAVAADPVADVAATCLVSSGAADDACTAAAGAPELCVAATATDGAACVWTAAVVAGSTTPGITCTFVDAVHGIAQAACESQCDDCVDTFYPGSDETQAICPCPCPEWEEAIAAHCARADGTIYEDATTEDACTAE
eukprot:SAG11_NODE_6024_length_1407_cov_1.164373_1_plen_292_part_10